MGSKTKTDKGFKKAQGIKKPLEKRLYNLEEASVYLGRPIFSIRGLIWKGVLPFVRDGRRMYLDLVDLDEYITKNKLRMV